MTLHDIESAVAGLTSTELGQFRTWYADFDAEAWDRKIEQDIQAGKLDTLASAAIRAHQQGKTQEL